MKQLRQLSQRLIAVNASQSKEVTSVSAERLERQKVAITRRIDEIVYELYGVSKRDVALIESSVGA